MASVDTAYFALSDQDDVWDASKIRRSLDVLRSREALLVYSDVRVCDEAGNVTERAYLRNRGIRPATGRDPIPFVFRNPAIGHTFVGRREVAEAARDIPLDLVFHEAWIVAAACRSGEVSFIDDQLGSYRMHTSNVAGPKDSRAARRVLDLARKPGRLARRQQTRAAGLRAVALLHPEFSWIADLYSRRDLSRLRCLPRLSVFMARLAQRIGVAAAATELAMFILDSIAVNDRKIASGRPGHGSANAPTSTVGR
jgi:hypothetical protein